MDKVEYTKESRIDNRTIKEIFPNSRDIINYAFTLDGVDYFEFNNFDDCPCERGFKALSYFNEMSMRCSREYLQAHCLAMDNLFSNVKSINLLNVATLHTQMKERLDWIVEPDILLKLASVVFFDSNENPYRYDFKYGNDKVEKFRNMKDSFFLSTPIRKLIPYTWESDYDMLTYLKTLTLINQQMIQNISTMLSSEQRNLDCFKVLESLSTKVSA